MKSIFRIVLVAALAALGIWLWIVLFPSPEKVIRKRLVELARTVSSSSSESDLARLAAARSVAGFFSTNVELNVELPELGRRNSLDREEITQAALMARSRAGGVQVKFPDINIAVAPDKQSAVADLTVQANVSGEHDPFVQQMKFTLQKIDGRWLITRVETVRTLSWCPQIYFRHFELCTAAGAFHI
ncbi:MAG: hypothetical protein ABSG80_06895 [Verrucomicrobiota bacterium]|jgi:hypothetical protein